MGKYYIYRHVRLDKNEPFYIGIGTKPDTFNSFKKEYSRAFTFDKNHRNPMWVAIFSKTKIDVEILYESDILEEAIEKEIEFIDIYKRKIDDGSLANLSLGGYGCTGFKLSDDAKAKIGEASRKRVWTPEMRKHASDIRKNIPTGRPPSEETIEKLKKINTGKIYSEETKQKISKSLMGKMVGSKNARSKPVLQFDLSGNFIKEWECILAAEKATGANNINCVLNGTQKKSGGFVWKYKE